MFKVIIAGGRDFSDYSLLSHSLDHLLSKKSKVQVISGGAKGADLMAVKYAKSRNLPFTIFRADWDGNGKSAGYIRNIEMAAVADACVCFWDGSSKGTEHMIRICREKKIQLRVIRY